MTATPRPWSRQVTLEREWKAEASNYMPPCDSCWLLVEADEFIVNHIEAARDALRALVEACIDADGYCNVCDALVDEVGTRNPHANECTVGEAEIVLRDLEGAGL